MTFVVFNVLFTFSFDKMFQAYLLHFCPRLGVSYFSSHPWFLVVGIGTEMPQYALLLFLSILKSSLV